VTKEDFFRFKFFTLYQDSSRKVFRLSTDALILGSWATHGTEKRILDVGTGTGVLSLMSAQKCPEAHIFAIDHSPEAIALATKNVSSSPFHARITPVLKNFKEFGTECLEKFDLILSNPPFFENSMLPKGAAYQSAKHTIDLHFTDLFRLSGSLLTSNGNLVFICPEPLQSTILLEAKLYGFYLVSKLMVSGTKDLKPNRVVFRFSKQHSEPVTEWLFIRNPETGGYTEDYIFLTEEFHEWSEEKRKSD